MHSFNRSHHLPLLCRRCAAGSPNKLGQSCRRDEVGVFRNTDSRHIQWESKLGEELSRCDAFIWWELKTCVLKGEDLRAGEVGTNLNGPDWGNKRLLVISRERYNPFPTRVLHATFDIVWAKDEVGTLHRLEFIMMPHTGVGWRKDALIIGDNSCGAFLLRTLIISPTKLSRGMGYAYNIPKRDIYFGFLHGGDTMETKSYR
jgi:hypothetical protein